MRILLNTGRDKLLKGKYHDSYGKQIADAVVASARSSGYFKPYDETPNWKDFYDRVAAKLSAGTPVNNDNDFNAISAHVLTAWPKALQQKLYDALYKAGCRIYKS
jgi:hypothetical protein